MKVLFFIHDLGQGGAEKVLVNLVNHMDPGRFDVTVLALFGGGVNEQFLQDHVKFRAVFPRMIPGNSHLMKLFSPHMLHRMFIKDQYDVEIAFLEGPDARIISGSENADTRRITWIHSMQMTEEQVSASFRSRREARRCYSLFDRIVGVSNTVLEQFRHVMPVGVPTEVLYNVNDSERVCELSKLPPAETLPEDRFKLIAVGKLIPVKGFDRLLRVFNRLHEEGYPLQLLLLGEGPEKGSLTAYVDEHGLGNTVSFLGYQTNPYSYLAAADLFVCSSFSEGYSTAATEALIVGTPVCTTDVSGMQEMLGDSEYGLIVDNSEQALYDGIRKLLDDPKLLAHYREAAGLRGKCFNTENTVKAVENLLEQITEN